LPHRVVWRPLRSAPESNKGAIRCRAALDELIKRGKVAPGRTDLARTGIGIAVCKGESEPDVSSPEALKRALLAAKSIAHTAPAGGGVTAAHVMGVLNRLGIAAEVTPKVKLAAGGPNGRVSVLVSSGEAEVVQRSGACRTKR
jgi:molybdate transport system substrate-binding protein